MNPHGAAPGKPGKPAKFIPRAVVFTLFLDSGILVLAYAAYTIADAHAYQALRRPDLKMQIISSVSSQSCSPRRRYGELEVRGWDFKQCCTGRFAKILRPRGRTCRRDGHAGARATSPWPHATLSFGRCVIFGE